MYGFSSIDALLAFAESPHTILEGVVHAATATPVLQQLFGLNGSSASSQQQQGVGGKDEPRWQLQLAGNQEMLIRLATANTANAPPSVLGGYGMSYTPDIVTNPAADGCAAADAATADQPRDNAGPTVQPSHTEPVNGGASPYAQLAPGTSTSTATGAQQTDGNSHLSKGNKESGLPLAPTMSATADATGHAGAADGMPPATAAAQPSVACPSLRWLMAVVSAAAIKLDAGTQTPTHFIEQHKDLDYEWNEWALRKRVGHVC